MYSSIETAPMYNRTIIRGDIASQRFGDTGIISECSLGVNLVSDNFCYVVSDTSLLYKI